MRRTTARLALVVAMGCVGTAPALAQRSQTMFNNIYEWQVFAVAEGGTFSGCSLERSGDSGTLRFFLTTGGSWSLDVPAGGRSGIFEAYVGTENGQEVFTLTGDGTRAITDLPIAPGFDEEGTLIVSIDGVAMNWSLFGLSEAVAGTDVCIDYEGDAARLAGPAPALPPGAKLPDEAGGATPPNGAGTSETASTGFVAPPRLPIAAVIHTGNMRAGPGTQYPVTGGFTRTTPVLVVEDTGVPFDGYNWFRVEMSDGATSGYVWGALVCADYPGANPLCR
ncbi:MAG: SH3 domain-containing protein [Hyphomicrobiaceae bacterium]|nr:SH3 domain-containing protein [Hyphomicrobiaceae bacterium]